VLAREQGNYLAQSQAANREEDLEVTAWINDVESEAEQVEVVERFIVPARYHGCDTRS
jgi:hypothetical protein